MIEQIINWWNSLLLFFDCECNHCPADKYGCNSNTCKKANKNFKKYREGLIKE